MSYNTGSAPPRRRSAKSNSEPSSNGSSPPASVNLTNGNNMNQVANNINLNAANNNNNAPKYGTLVPNRVFVGGISSTTTESELCQLFSKYGNVKATKIIADRAGVSKGYGFVTFETDEEAKRLQLDADNIILKERRLNIAPAIMKQGPQVRYERRDRRKKEEIIIQVEESVERNGEDQAFPQRGFDATASPPPMNALYLSNGIPYPCSYQNGTVFFAQPQLQAAPMPGAPDAPMYPGATYGPTQGPSPTYAPAMMYPYGNPGQMFIPPYQPYPQLQMASQPHMMYTNSTLQTLNNGTDTPSPISMSPHGTPPFFVQGDMRPDMFFIPPPAPGQAYPPFPTPVMLQNTAPEAVQYCEVPIEQQSTNVQGEVPQPTAEEAVVVTNEVQNEVTPEPETHALAETPVVSAKLIHRTEEQKTEYRRNDRHVEVDHGRHGNGQKHNLNNNNSTYTNNNYYKKESGNSNGRGGGYRGGRGGHRMNGGCGRRNFHRSSASPETYSSPHPNNNVNTNLNLQHQNYPGRIHQLPYQASNTASHTTVVAAVGQQMQTAHAQYNMAHPPPPVPHHVPTNVPPRRFNLQHSNNQRRSYQNNHYGRKRGDAVDNGAAGDAPINNKELNPSSTAKGSPPPLVSSSEQDLLVSGMKKMNVQ